MTDHGLSGLIEKRKAAAKGEWRSSCMTDDVSNYIIYSDGDEACNRFGGCPIAVAQPTLPEDCEQRLKDVGFIVAAANWTLKHAPALQSELAHKDSVIASQLTNLTRLYDEGIRDAQIIANLRAENERHLNAVMFYADLNKYEGISLGISPLNDDRGQVARKALNGKDG